MRRIRFDAVEPMSSFRPFPASPGPGLPPSTYRGLPVVTKEKQPCRPSGRAKRLRLPCHAELVFLAEGPFLRFCWAKSEASRKGKPGHDEPGHLFPVKGPREAFKIVKQICDCASQDIPTHKLKGRTEKTRHPTKDELFACMTPEVRESGRLGRLPRRRRRRRR